jgi:hypothetical protein
MRARTLLSLPAITTAAVSMSILGPVVGAHAAGPDFAATSRVAAVASTTGPAANSETPVPTAAEIAYCMQEAHLTSCLVAFRDATAATTQAQILFPTSLHNGAGDAFRHCYWSAQMTIHLGRDAAKTFGELHEVDPLQPAVEAQMDLRNDNAGRVVGLLAYPAFPALRMCAGLASAGYLWTVVDGKLVTPRWP